MKNIYTCCASIIKGATAFACVWMLVQGAADSADSSSAITQTTPVASTAPAAPITKNESDDGDKALKLASAVIPKDNQLNLHVCMLNSARAVTSQIGLSDKESSGCISLQNKTNLEYFLMLLNEKVRDVNPSNKAASSEGQLSSSGSNSNNTATQTSPKDKDTNKKHERSTVPSIEPKKHNGINNNDINNNGIENFVGELKKDMEKHGFPDTSVTALKHQIDEVIKNKDLYLTIEQQEKIQATLKTANSAPDEISEEQNSGKQAVTKEQILKVINENKTSIQNELEDVYEHLKNLKANESVADSTGSNASSSDTGQKSSADSTSSNASSSDTVQESSLTWEKHTFLKRMPRDIARSLNIYARMPWFFPNSRVKFLLGRALDDIGEILAHVNTFGLFAQSLENDIWAIKPGNWTKWNQSSDSSNQSEASLALQKAIPQFYQKNDIPNILAQKIRAIIRGEQLFKIHGVSSSYYTPESVKELAYQSLIRAIMGSSKQIYLHEKWASELMAQEQERKQESKGSLADKWDQLKESVKDIVPENTAVTTSQGQDQTKSIEDVLKQIDSSADSSNNNAEAGVAMVSINTNQNYAFMLAKGIKNKLEPEKNTDQKKSILSGLVSKVTSATPKEDTAQIAKKAKETDEWIIAIVAGILKSSGGNYTENIDAKELEEQIKALSDFIKEHDQPYNVLYLNFYHKVQFIQAIFNTPEQSVFQQLSEVTLGASMKFLKIARRYECVDYTGDHLVAIQEQMKGKNTYIEETIAKIDKLQAAKYDQYIDAWEANHKNVTATNVVGKVTQTLGGGLEHAVKMGSALLNKELSMKDELGEKVKALLKDLFDRKSVQMEKGSS